MLPDICLLTLSIPRREQFSATVAWGKLWFIFYLFWKLPICPSNIFHNARRFENWGISLDTIPSFSWGIFSHITICLDHLHASKNIWWITKVHIIESLDNVTCIHTFQYGPQLICIENLISQNSERRILKQWAADSKEELSLANKELTAVSKL